MTLIFDLLTSKWGHGSPMSWASLLPIFNFLCYSVLDFGSDSGQTDNRWTGSTLHDVLVYGAGIFFFSFYASHKLWVHQNYGTGCCKLQHLSLPLIWSRISVWIWSLQERSLSSHGAIGQNIASQSTRNTQLVSLANKLSCSYYVCLFVYIIMFFFSTLVLIVSNFIVACAFVTCY